MEIVVRALAAGPECASRLWEMTTSAWPTFMLADPNSGLYYDDVESAHPEHVLVAFSSDDPTVPLARACSAPLHWDRPVEELPAGGWDWVIRQSCADRLSGRS